MYKKLYNIKLYEINKKPNL